MAKMVADKLNKGISPQRFMDDMMKNKDAFISLYNGFEWPNEEDKEFFESLNNRDDLRCLILMADWCGDVVKNIPVVFRALEISGIPTEVLIKEEHPDTMQQFLTMGGEAVPIVIFADTGGAVLGQWGPRPSHVQEVMTAFKQSNPDRDAADYQDKLAAAREEMGRRYGEGTGYQVVIIQELRDLIARL
ncbi:thioredoxin family protein [Paenibacillus tarimensis]|uniref:thioredoxin family protein n=1 Tax=Paenibacillus tarimensis TaxID=416012 RepID=UPI001F3E48D5|nr:thioredoxin family protein [Paenibacillus tarimensis]MCF2943664.1 thioredoxin family protein [Paenibacillus tarimensis]